MSKLIIFCSLCLISCSEKSIEDSQQEIKPEWSSLSLKISNDYKNERLFISNNSDTCRYMISFKDSLNKIDSSYYQLESYIILTQEQRNQLFQTFNSIINERVHPNNTVSCYAGDYVRFDINPYDAVTTSLSYASIQGWSTISKSTQLIFQSTIGKIYQYNTIQKKYQSQ